MADMTGKVVLITGATNGIGKMAALEIAKIGATVVIVGRNPEKTEQVLAELKQQSGNEQIDMLLADLSVMEQVRSVTAAFKAKYDRLDVLLNNAGAFFSDRRESADGFELTFALNHLNYFLLTNLLLDMLKASSPARIVNVSSEAHQGVREINWDNLDGKQSYGMAGFQAYGLSKLANILFTRELARRLDGTGVTANSLHPGTVATGFGQNNNNLLIKVLLTLFKPFLKSPEQGAETLIYLSTAATVDGVTGKYFASRAEAATSALAQDDEAARRLWDISAQMVGLSEPA